MSGSAEANVVEKASTLAELASGPGSTLAALRSLQHCDCIWRRLLPLAKFRGFHRSLYLLKIKFEKVTERKCVQSASSSVLRAPVKGRDSLIPRAGAASNDLNSKTSKNLNDFVKIRSIMQLFIHRKKSMLNS